MAMGNYHWPLSHCQPYIDRQPVENSLNILGTHFKHEKKSFYGILWKVNLKHIPQTKEVYIIQ